MPTSKFSQNSLPLQLSFLVFSMLLNSIGLIILKYSETNIGYNNLGLLEAFKDIPIVLGSILFVNTINKFGHKKSLIFSLIGVAICCFIMPFINDFWFIKLWFSLIGLSFAISKISVFALIHNIEKDERQLSKTMSRVESFFMMGIFAVNSGFAWLINSEYNQYWKFGFAVIGIISLFTSWMLYQSNYPEHDTNSTNEIKRQQSLNGFTAILTKRNLAFLCIIFFVVFVEQCLNSWLPTFYKNDLEVNSFFALQSVAFLALFSFIGRYLTSKLIIYFSWKRYIIFCLSAIFFLMLGAQLLLIDIQQNWWLLILTFPLLGLFISPLYPLYNAKFLYDISTEKNNIYISLIMIASAFGSSIGSLYMSFIFYTNYHYYFILFILAPIIIIFTITLLIGKNLISRN